MKRIVITAVLMLGVVLGFTAQAMAATDNIVISATVNSKIIVTAGADHNFGSFDPDDPDPAPYVAAVNVRSNVPYTFVRSYTSDTFPAGMLAINTPAGMNDATMNPVATSTSGFDWAQTYTLNLTPGGNWADPGSYSADVLYTALP